MKKKIIKFDKEARQDFLDGLEILAKAVKSTLGPCGKCVVIDSEYSFPTSTKDGVTVAKNITLNDPCKNLFARLINDVAIKTNDKVGDGTTTSIVLAEALIKESNKKINLGFNPVKLRKGLEKIKNAAIQYIVKQSKNISVDDIKSLTKIANVSSNNDLEIGNIVAKAIFSSGKYGLVSVEEGRSSSCELALTEGMQINSGFTSPIFINNNQGTCNLENPLILITDAKITNVDYVLQTLEYARNRANRPIIYICDDASPDVYRLFSFNILNVIPGVVSVCCIKAPSFGDDRTEILKDLSCVVKAKFLSKEIENFESFDPTVLGGTRLVKITQNDSAFIGGYGSDDDIKERMLQVQEKIDKITNENVVVDQFNLEKLQSRYSKLSNGVCTILVGGATAAEMSERKDRVIDAVSSTKAAIEEGISHGGGLIYINIYRNFEKLINDSDIKDSNEIEGANILKEALCTPFKTIIDNSELSSELLLYKILLLKDNNMCVDALNNKICNMIDSGIVDATKVCRIALENAISSAILFLSISASITNNPEKNKINEKSHNMF